MGDGEDSVRNTTGTGSTDGKRDDLNDSAWTAPVWFAAPPGDFVWSKNSGLYHDADCFVVANIASANRQSGPAPCSADCGPRRRTSLGMSGIVGI